VGVQGENLVYSEMDSMGKALEEAQNRLTELQDQSAKKDAASAQFMMQVSPSPFLFVCLLLLLLGLWFPD